MQLNNEEQQKSDLQGDKYSIHIDNFDGPLDLLWDLIRRSKIEIIDISISQITEQYISYLKYMESLNISIASEFITMASDLLYYKSKALLPTGEMDEDFFVPPLPPELIAKLLEFKKYQMSSETLRNMYAKHSDSYPREYKIETPDQQEADEYTSMSLFDLLSAFVEVIGSTKKVEEHQIKFDEILVSERIEFIVGMLKKKEKIFFTDLFPKKSAIAMVVVTLLAILEMTKLQKIKIMQMEPYSPISIYRNFDPGDAGPGVETEKLTFE